MIIIRKAKVGDEKAITKYSNENIKSGKWVYTGSNIPKTKKNIRELRKSLSDKIPSQYFFIALDNKKVVGVSNIRFKSKGRLRHRAEIGWSVHYNYQGRGIGTKLVKIITVYAKKKGLKRIEGEIAVENKASIKLAKDIGFKIEGRKKKAMLLDNGRYIDTYIVGKLL